MVGAGNSGGAIASRVSFRDAIPAANTTGWREWYDDIRTLAILGGPNVTATEFYMVDVPGSDFYNYDYRRYISPLSRPNQPSSLTD